MASNCTDAMTTQCLVAQGETDGFCSFQCATQVTVMSDAMSQIALSEIPQTNHDMCAAGFTGDGGQPACGIITAANPLNPDGSFPPNTEITIDASCAVLCSMEGQQCPTGTTCVGGQFCFEM
jgi:hypothetical protein